MKLLLRLRRCFAFESGLKQAENVQKVVSCQGCISDHQTTQVFFVDVFKRLLEFKALECHLEIKIRFIYHGDQMLE